MSIRGGKMGTKLPSFPSKKPKVEPDPHGWFRKSNEWVLGNELDLTTDCVIELGSWLGKSTRFIAENAPNAKIYAIDHWKGSPEHHEPHRVDVKDKLPTLYETFLVNCWEYKDQIVPLKMDTKKGLLKCYEKGLKPSLVYIDAGHDYESVLQDVQASHGYFPNAVLVGDDWERPGVHRAVIAFAYEQARDMVLGVYQNTWWLKCQN